MRVYSLDKVKASLKQEKYIIKKKLVLVCTFSLDLLVIRTKVLLLFDNVNSLNA